MIPSTAQEVAGATTALVSGSIAVLLVIRQVKRAESATVAMRTLPAVYLTLAAGSLAATFAATGLEGAAAVLPILVIAGATLFVAVRFGVHERK